MTLLSLNKVHLGYGRPLLDGVSFSIEKGERVALVGRNGTGKSTFLKLLDGRIQADDGQIAIADGVRIARLDQEVPLETSGSVFDIVATGLGPIGEAIQKFHHLTSDMLDPTPQMLAELEACQGIIEAANAWDLEKTVEDVLNRLALPVDADIETLSGGLKRRVLLAKALASQPDILLLDEPTNHLDLEAILWLEDFLLSWSGTLIFITHDRAFLQRLATRIIELDRGVLTDFPGDYGTYLKRKQELLDAESKTNSEFDKRLAQEETWIRQGIKARRTRDMGRVKRLVEMRKERLERRDRIGQVKMQTQEAERSGKLVVEIKDASFSYGDQTLIKDLSCTILRGDKVGIIGPNGCGKTTLLRLMLGDLEPSNGQIRTGTNLQIAYFDQYRSTLDEEATVIDNVAHGSDRVTINGKNTHVIGYLQDFLFTPDRARQPVKSLSGGERNRLLLARLFAQPANLLVLDEPTNDLDAETLELLEELLTEYTGTILVVSHDRAFLNNVVTSVLVYEGEAQISEYVGGYDDWIRQKKTLEESIQQKASQETALKTENKLAQGKASKKMSYKEQQELDQLPQKIETLENEISELLSLMQDSGFYQQGKDETLKTTNRLDQAQKELELAFSRWELLEGIKNSSA